MTDSTSKNDSDERGYSSATINTSEELELYLRIIREPVRRSGGEIKIAEEELDGSGVLNVEMQPQFPDKKGYVKINIVLGRLEDITDEGGVKVKLWEVSTNGMASAPETYIVAAENKEEAIKIAEKDIKEEDNHKIKWAAEIDITTPGIKHISYSCC